MDRGSSCRLITDSSKSSETRVGKTHRSAMRSPRFVPNLRLPSVPSNYRFNVCGPKTDLVENGTALLQAAEAPFTLRQAVVLFKDGGVQVSWPLPAKSAASGVLICCASAGSCICTRCTQGLKQSELDQGKVNSVMQLATLRSTWDKRTEIEMGLLEKCRFSVSKLKNELSKKKYSFSKQQLERFLEANQNRLWVAAMDSGLASKMVETYLESIEEDQLKQMISDFEKHLGFLINHQYGNFIVRLMIAKSEDCRKICSEFCLNHFKELVKKKYSVSVMRRLASHSPEFCKVAFEIFRVNLDQFADRNSDSLLMLSTLMDLCQDQKILIKLASNIKSKLREEKHHPLLRAVTSIITNMPIETVEGLVDVLVTNLFSYIDDAIGNYVIQNLYQKYPEKVLPKLSSAFKMEPLLVFSNKYRRHVFLSIDESEFKRSLERTIIEYIEKNPQSLIFLLRRSESLDLLLLLIFRTLRVERFLMLLDEELKSRKGKRPKPSSQHHVSYYEEFQQKLETLLAYEAKLPPPARLQA